MNGPMQWTRNGMVPVGTDANRGDVLPSNDEVDEAETEVAPAPVARPIVIKKPAQASTKREPAPNVLKLARARLRFVEREIRELRKLEKERDELRRLIDAATNKPRAVVRELPRKTSAG